MKKRVLKLGILSLVFAMTLIGCPSPEVVDYTLTLTVPETGIVEVKGGDTVLKAPYAVAEGRELTLTATPNAGFAFGAWTGASTSSDNPLSIIMDENKIIGITFTQLRTLTLESVDNGTVEVKDGDTVLKAPYAVAEGKELTFTATPNTGFAFGAWTGANTSVDNPLSIIMDENKIIGASFHPLKSSLTIEALTNGSVEIKKGSATLTNNPAVVDYGVELTLTAIPNEGYHFERWTGATGANPLKIIMDEDKSIGAIFAFSGEISIDTVLVAGGSFIRNLASITLTQFNMSRTEVTQKQYLDVMTSWPSLSVPNSTYGVGDNFPAYYVSWFDALEFCNALSLQDRLAPCYTISKTGSDTDQSGWTATCDFTASGYRLPTEAEWEYAAGGGANNRTVYAGTNNESELGNYAWYNNIDGAKTKSVRTKSANALGLYDMSGNVKEWCWDFYEVAYPSGDQTDPVGPAGVTGGSRVMRGGSFNLGTSFLPVSMRDLSSPNDRDYIVGFRLVVAVAP